MQKQQTKADILLDILVVDNACDPDCEADIAAMNKTATLPIYYVTEKQTGIVAARNKCVQHFLTTSAQYLLFIDDDEWPKDNDWALKLLDTAKNYQADVVTSHVISVAGKNTPQWATELIYGENHFKSGQKLPTFYTNNVLIKRPVLERFYPPFDFRFAKTGASDFHFALKCAKQGIYAIYADAPVLEEFPNSRATLSWFLKRGLRSGIGYTRSHLFEDSLLRVLIRAVVFSILRSIRGLGDVLLGTLSLKKSRLYRGLFRISSALGTLLGLFGFKHNEYVKVHGQ
ncbi:glycosyltransferase [Thalassotalea aquiviva]|uniref:glycosyltransferase n=1 Tax=Thalassotalea aquiviva TaxID=3242415 RepID=UPI00352BA26E